MKKEEWFAVSKRTTTPSTIYKKQKLDRDDIVDITDFDIVMWLKGEMRLMLDEEIARAILIGDGRAVDDEDKIKDPMGATEGAGIRSILHDHDLYVTVVNIDDSARCDRCCRRSYFGYAVLQGIGFSDILHDVAGTYIVAACSRYSGSSYVEDGSRAGF